MQDSCSDSFIESSFFEKRDLTQAIQHGKKTLKHPSAHSKDVSLNKKDSNIIENHKIQKAEGRLEKHAVLQKHEMVV